MPDVADILWFKNTFHEQIDEAVAETPFDLDMLTAIACQETGPTWQVLRKKALTTQQILALCVGDTLDEDRGRKAFPRTKDALAAVPNGQRMFEIAHEALVAMAQHIPGYQGAASRPNKFCHAFGVFQYDLQFFLTDPDYFLEKRYEDYSETLGKCLTELHRALERNGWEDKETLTDMEMAGVAIAYNAGTYRPSKGLRQGHFDGTKFYGEGFFDFLRLSRTVALPGAVASLPPSEPGSAAIPSPTPVSATGPFYIVDTQTTTLHLRSEPMVSSPDPNSNVVADLPDGHLVRSVTGTPKKGFLEVETSLFGAHHLGFASTKFLKPAPNAVDIPVVVPAAAPPASGIVAVYMPRKPGTITRRTDLAGPHSLNEAGQPGRAAAAPGELRSELAKIIAWLAVDKAGNKRYQPRDGMTFCNIYAHDYCHLAGVYLPRVWWTPKAIEDLAQGKNVEPLYNATIEEVRANGLFRWLRDFGPRFGWRQTGTLSKLQQEVNQGAIGLIVALRRDDGRPGHIAAVVSETDELRARRDSAGEVVAPVQSQAGSTNFQHGLGRAEWWKGEQFADSGFWLHS